ncbi:MAG: lipopolysaccharide heptosyltransferase II [bacterium]
MRTLVIGLNWLGDALMALPALHALRRRTCFDVLTKPGVAPVYAMSGLPDQVVLLQSGLMGVWRAARAVRAGGYEQVYVMPRSFRAALIARLAGIPRRFGLPGHARDGLLTDVVRPLSDPTHTHQQYEYLALMGAADKDAGHAAVRLPIADGARRAALAQLAAGNSNGPWVFLFPGAARGASKQWPKERFIEVGRRLIQAGGRVIVCGTGLEIDTCQWVVAMIGPSAVNLAGKTSLTDLAALLSCATVVVANDSGGMHLAAAVGAPVVAIFGLTDPAITGPLGMGHRVLQAPGVMSGRDVPRRSEAAARALAAVSATSVSEAALAIMLNTEHLTP